jgi:ubiquinone/menaquinone biosynthesis C-methylase UbiE
MATQENGDWTTEDWIRKLKQQARDSHTYRHKLYDRVGLARAERILDVGCGTASVTIDIAQSTKGHVIGIDVDEAKLEEARRALDAIPNMELRVADVQDLPFEDEAFDLVVTNIVLVYVQDKQKALDEMARVTASGGYVLATLEPDYAGWFQYPEGEVVDHMIAHLKGLGADPKTGRKLKWLFTKAGLETEVGMDTEDDFIFQTDDQRKLERFDEERWVYHKLLSMNGWEDEAAERYIDEERERIVAGLSFNFMPGFYAIGKKP